METKIFYWLCLILIFAGIVFLIPFLTSCLFGFMKFSPGILLGIGVVLLVKNRLHAYLFGEPLKENRQKGLAIGLIVLSLILGTIQSISRYRSKQLEKKIWESGIMEDFIDEKFGGEEKYRRSKAGKERRLRLEVMLADAGCPVYVGDSRELSLVSVQMDTANSMVNYVYKMQSVDKGNLSDPEIMKECRTREDIVRKGILEDFENGNASSFDTLIAECGYGAAFLFFGRDSSFFYGVRFSPEEHRVALYGEREGREE